jgi:hypothetical protein
MTALDIEKDLLDDDGENRAVRSFLMQYSCDRSVSVAAMRQHMTRSGWNGCWPEWANDSDNQGHLTKGGAQDWIRYLFSLEPAAKRSTQPVAGVPAQAGTVASGGDGLTKAQIDEIVYRLRLDGQDSTYNIVNSAIAAIKAAGQGREDAIANAKHCPHCGTNEIDLVRTCHNSACNSYACGETVYRGWVHAAITAKGSQG